MLSADSDDAKDDEDDEEGDGFNDEDDDVPGAENIISDKILGVWDPTISDLW